MTGLISLYEKELLDVIGLKVKTVKNYVACIISFFNFINERSIDLESVNGKHLMDFTNIRVVKMRPHIRHNFRGNTNLDI